MIQELECFLLLRSTFSDISYKKFQRIEASPYRKTQLRENTNLWKLSIQRCSYEKVFWKYETKIQENTHAEVRFQ